MLVQACLKMHNHSYSIMQCIPPGRDIRVQKLDRKGWCYPGLSIPDATHAVYTVLASGVSEGV